MRPTMLLYHSNAGGAIFPIIFFARGRKIRSTDVQRDVMTMEKTLRALQGLPDAGPLAGGMKPRL